MTESQNFKTFLIAVASGLFMLIGGGMLWFLFLGPAAPVGFGWYLFSFAAGLTMIVLPCTLPLAFVIVPLSMGKGAAKGIGIAIVFGLGVAFTLSLYGVIAAVIGEVAIGTLGAPLETVKNWLYFFAGAAAYLFALGELGFIKVRMPSYTGAAPAFIQRRQDYLKAFFSRTLLGEHWDRMSASCHPLDFHKNRSLGERLLWMGAFPCPCDWENPALDTAGALGSFGGERVAMGRRAKSHRGAHNRVGNGICGGIPDCAWSLHS